MKFQPDHQLVIPLTNAWDKGNAAAENRLQNSTRTCYWSDPSEQRTDLKTVGVKVTLRLCAWTLSSLLQSQDISNADLLPHTNAWVLPWIKHLTREGINPYGYISMCGNLLNHSPVVHWNGHQQWVFKAISVFGERDGQRKSQGSPNIDFKTVISASEFTRKHRFFIWCNS